MIIGHKTLGSLVFAALFLTAARRVAVAQTPAAKPASADAQVSASAAQAAPAAPAAQAPAAKAEEKPAVKAEEKPAAKAEEKSPAAKPEEKPAAKAEEKAAAVPAPKPLESCAAKVEPIAQAYQQAHDSFLSWLRSASDKMEEADQRIADLKSRIADKEAAITKLRLDSGSGASVAESQKQDQALWAELRAEQAKRAELCRALSRAAKQKIRELNQFVWDAAGKIEP